MAHTLKVDPSLLGAHTDTIHGSPLVRTASRETLSTHPLLSPTPSTSSASAVNGSPSEPNRQTPAPKYLPYTPRQRVPTGSVTTGTTVSAPISVSPQQHQGAGATSKLQLQNLKAAAQNIGLGTGSLGWAMLEELVLGQDRGSEWTDIWNIITAGQATILLPTEQVTSHEIITAEFMQDHIAFCNGDARNNAPLVTLSGLRGSIENEDLTIRSIVPPSSKYHKELFSPSKRTSALQSLQPLPETLSSSSCFPKFTFLSHTSSLPVPPRLSIVKPPLPPRPGTRSSPTPPSRLSNPFASFFSKSPASHPSPPAQGLEIQHIDHIVEVSAFTVTKPIIRRDLAKTIAKALRQEIKDACAGVPSWAIDRVQKFSQFLGPFSKSAKPKDGVGSLSSKSSYFFSSIEDPWDDVAKRFQTFYRDLEDDLRSGGGTPSLLRRRDREDRRSDDEQDPVKAEKVKHDEEKIREIMEKVERAVCTVFYDRLFCPPSVDDASHDEALSSRIAALNMLDLGFEHLGVDVGSAGSQVETVSRECGKTISDVKNAWSPAAKAALLVTAHKALVDGLGKLPPLRLKAESEIDATPSPRTPNHALNQSEVDEEPNQLRSGTAIPNANDVTTSVPNKTNASEKPQQDAVPVLEAPPRTDSLTVTATKPTPVSGDILLPLIIFSVVKANPPQLVSHLLFTERFRNQSVGGEESYCLINLMAVVEFLENVDLGALGLKDSEKIVSIADLSPIPLSISQEKVAQSHGFPALLRDRVGEQVDAIAGSANKVISGVVDTSFGVLRAILPIGAEGDGADGITRSLPRGFGLLRRESGFSIASLAASLPGRERARSVLSHKVEEHGQEMVESRPASIKSVYLDDSDSSDARSDDAGSAVGDESDDEGAHDARSIRSFEQMMNDSKRRPRKDLRERMSLTDRLASMSRLTRPSHTSHSQTPSASHDAPAQTPSMESPPTSRPTSLLPPGPAPGPNRIDSPVSSRDTSPHSGLRNRIALPNRRFLETAADDLKLSEIPELLLEYRRIVDSARAAGLFDES